MEYRVFYSYQSDIEKDLNETFIENALKEAAKKIKGNTIKVVKGIRDTSGQKPLAQTMFDQSANSDIFIGDVTYTSSRSNHIENRCFTFREKEYLTRVRGSVKMSPNPNVLIETGYSWGKKDYDRTILVMNKAFGEPDDFPIDMGHVRWPITYSLKLPKEADPENYKRTYDELVKDITGALIAAIKTSQNYHRERFRPFKIHSDWKNADFKNTYELIDEIKTIIKQLRAALNISGNPQRLVGPKNSGKTRLAYELYRKQDSDIGEDLSIEKVLYYDLELTGYASIEKQLLDLATLNQDKVLIIDNCGIKEHKRICDDLLDKNLRILTIDEFKSGDQRQESTSMITSEIAEKIVELSVNKKFTGKNAISLIQSAKGNVREALAFINSPITDLSDLDSNYENKWEQILGKELHGKKALSVLESISIFTHLGFSNQYQAQGEFVSKELLNNFDYDLFKNFINIFIERGMVKQQGDFIILETFTEELASNWWKKQNPDLVNKLFSDISKVGLSKQISDRLGELIQTDYRDEILKIIVNVKGTLSEFDYINTEEGAKTIMGLSVVIPELIMNILSNIFDTKSKVELQDFGRGRQYIVWALENLCFRKETFDAAAKILFKLALSENENIANNATSQFVHLFQPFLSGTEVGLNERINLFKELEDKTDLDKTSLLLSACDRALSTRDFIRSGSADKQAGKVYKDYVPETNELMEYWSFFINYLIENC